MTELAGILVGNYFLLECLAKEGMVETYRARPTTRGGVDVLLRLFRPPFPDPTAFREYFPLEVEKVWRCQHPHLLPLYEFGTGSELLYCASIMPESPTLEQLLAHDEGKMTPVAQACSLILQLSSALEYLHEHAIVHGNVQPGSIYVRGETLLLTNLSMRHAYQPGESLMVQQDDFHPDYCAPEQKLGIVTVAGDLYALGVLLYRLLGGRLPFPRATAEQMQWQQEHAELYPLSRLRVDLPAGIDLVIEKILNKVPERRFESVADFARVLRMLFSMQTESVDGACMQPRRIPVQAHKTASAYARSVALVPTRL